MILVRPLLLLALLVLPVLWFLSRAARQRRDVTVPSLLIWRRLGLQPKAPRETRRHADRLLVLRLVLAALAAFGLAGPRLAPGTAPPSLHVLIDESPSMGAFAGRTADALRAVRESAPKGARVVLHRGPGTADLARVLVQAGEGSVVVVTDHLPPGLARSGRVRVLLVGGPVANVGIVSAWIEETGKAPVFSAVVRNYAGQGREVRVVHPGGSEPITLAPGEATLIRGPAPGGRAVIALEPGDAFAFDDRVVLETVPARKVALRWIGPEEPRLSLALEVGGIRIDEAAAGAVIFRGEARPGGRLLVAPPGEKMPVRPGSVVGGPDLPPEAVPGPNTPLGSAHRLRGGGEVLLSDDLGSLALVREGRVEVALDPADPGSAWAADPSFPIFFAEVARRLGAAEPGSRIVEGVPDEEESATRGASAPYVLEGLRASAPEEAANGVDLSPYLFLAAAILLLVHGLLEAKRTVLSFPRTA